MRCTRPRASLPRCRSAHGGSPPSKTPVVHTTWRQKGGRGRRSSPPTTPPSCNVSSRCMGHALTVPSPRPRPECIATESFTSCGKHCRLLAAPRLRNSVYARNIALSIALLGSICGTTRGAWLPRAVGVRRPAPGPFHAAAQRCGPRCSANFDGQRPDQKHIPHELGHDAARRGHTQRTLNPRRLPRHKGAQTGWGASPNR